MCNREHKQLLSTFRGGREQGGERMADRNHLNCRMSRKRIEATKRRAFPTAEWASWGKERGASWASDNNGLGYKIKQTWKGLLRARKVADDNSQLRFYRKFYIPRVGMNMLFLTLTEFCTSFIPQQSWSWLVNSYSYCFPSTLWVVCHTLKYNILSEGRHVQSHATQEGSEEASSSDAAQVTRNSGSLGRD